MQGFARVFLQAAVGHRECTGREMRVHIVGQCDSAAAPLAAQNKGPYGPIHFLQNMGPCWLSRYIRLICTLFSTDYYDNLCVMGSSSANHDREQIATSRHQSS